MDSEEPFPFPLPFPLPALHRHRSVRVPMIMGGPFLQRRSKRGLQLRRTLQHAHALLRCYQGRRCHLDGFRAAPTQIFKRYKVSNQPKTGGWTNCEYSIHLTSLVCHEARWVLAVCGASTHARSELPNACCGHPAGLTAARNAAHGNPCILPTTWVSLPRALLYPNPSQVSEDRQNESFSDDVQWLLMSLTIPFVVLNICLYVSYRNSPSRRSTRCTLNPGSDRLRTLLYTASQRRHACTSTRKRAKLSQCTSLNVDTSVVLTASCHRDWHSS